MLSTKRILLIHFNSNLVRLKDNTELYTFISLYVFQFQSGTIKSISKFSPVIYSLIFQFQSGTIKSVDMRFAIGKDGHFNSNLVRLKAVKYWAELPEPP